MSDQPVPIYLGAFDPVHRGDVIDLAVDFSADLGEGETISDLQLDLQDASRTAVPGAVTAFTVTGGRVDLRLAAPSVPGSYRLVARISLSDGEHLTHTARVQVS